MLDTGDGHLVLDLNSTHLVENLKVHLPSAVRVGDSFDALVTGTLGDGTVVSLVGPECYVSYDVDRAEVLEIDGLGRAVARKKGVGTIVVTYEHQFARAQVEVQ